MVKNRPKSKCCNKPVYHSSNIEISFDYAINSPLISGISNYISLHKERVEKNKKTEKMTTISLNDLLDEYEAPKFIEYLSLDTEGSEYEILKTFNFDKYQFGLIDIEHNHDKEKRANIKDLLLSKGYKYIGQNGCDDRFCKVIDL